MSGMSDIHALIQQLADAAGISEAALAHAVDDLMDASPFKGLCE